MELIVISSDTIFREETGILNELFEEGLKRLHLRKPGIESSYIRSIIEDTKPEYRQLISLHSAHEIAQDLGVSGLHFSEQMRENTDPDFLHDLHQNGHLLSTSVHDLETVKGLNIRFNYSFFSPVFDSISKPGYKGIGKEKIRIDRVQSCTKIIALGGINIRNIERIKDMNFDGSALLGCLWSEPKTAVKNFKQIRDLCQ